MRKAIIDLGTNTFNLLVVDITTKTSFSILHEEKSPVRLGRGGLIANQILADAQERAIVALLNFKSIANNLGCEQLIAVGTSATRNALNKESFKEAVVVATGISIIELDGSSEAQLIFEGVRNSGVLSPEQITLIMDIGGGSTEFVICSNEQVIWKKSYDLGVARLLEMFHPHDPIEVTEVSTINNYLQTTLIELKEQINSLQPTNFVGSSGSFDTFLALQTEADSGKNFNLLDLPKLQQSIEALKASTLSERKAMRGMHQIRAEFIVLSAVLAEFIFGMHHFDTYFQSEYSLKEGLIFDTLLV